MEEEIKDKKNRNIKNIMKIILIIILIGVIISIIILYRENRNVQNFIDDNILKKTINGDNIPYIEYTNDTNTNVCAFGKYIGILSNNVLTAYNSYAKQEFTLNIAIAQPVFSSAGKYLAIGEENGNKIYLVADKNIVWQGDTEGKIEKIVVNQNGYIAVAVTQTSYKTIVITYNAQGKEICKTYLSNTYVADMNISSDNKNIAIAETNLSGIQVKSGIRIISLEKVEKDIENAVIYKENIAEDSIITSIYYDKINNLICMLNDKIIKIENGEKKEILEYSENTLFADIDLTNHIVKIEEEEKEQLEIKIIVQNTSNNRQREYIINAIPKQVNTKNKTIAVNTGSEAYFITERGFLNQKYESKQEIKEIVINENIAGIIYKNKIEIIKL